MAVNGTARVANLLGGAFFCKMPVTAALHFSGNNKHQRGQNRPDKIVGFIITPVYLGWTKRGRMHLTRVLNHVISLTRVNVIDNSEIGRQVKEAGKKVKIIRIYNKSRHQCGGLGDRVLVTILGQMKKGFVTGCVQMQQPFIPKFDSNNVVLVDDNNVPLGTRVTSPLPNYLRKQGAKTARIMALGTRFV